jgi:hypothetical protein
MKHKTPSLFEKTSETVLRDVKTWDVLVDRLQNTRLRDREMIQVVVLGSNRDMPLYFQSKNAPSGMRHIESSESISHFQYQRKFGRDSRRSVSGEFLLIRTASTTMYLLVCVSTPSFWRNGILPLTESLYPKASCPFLTQGELHSLLKDVQNEISPERIRILEFSSKKRLGGTSRKRFQSVREWTDMELEAAFGEARERNDWFRSVFFDIIAEKDGRLLSTGVQGKLSKYSYFACNARFELFERILLRKMVQLGAERLKFFSNRDRQNTKAHVANPLQIAYSQDIFKSKDQTKRLIAAMQKFRYGTCTILHANPYVHLTMVDNKDFSSADLWVLSQDEILLVPQIRSSAVALKRIVNHIFENFREGKISEYKSI